MATGYISVIEITSRWLKAVRAHNSTRGAVLLSCQVRDIGGLADDQVSLALKEWCDARRIALPGDRIVLVMPRRHVIMKILNLPSHDAEELRRIVALQASERTPYGREELVFEHVLLEREVSGYSRVLAIMMPTTVLDRYRAVCTGADRVPAQVTISSAGLARWSHVVLGTDVGGVVAVVDVDTEMTEICLDRGGEILFSRQVLTDDATRGDQRMVELARHYEMTLSAYEREGFVPGPKHILASLPGLDLKPVIPLARAQDVIIHAGALAGRTLLTANFTWPAEVLSSSVSVAAVCGAALYPGRLPVDLVHAGHREEENRSGARRVLLRSLALGMAGFLALAGALCLPFFQKNSELYRLEGQWRKLKPVLTRVSGKASQVRELEALAAGRLRVLSAVRELARLVSNNIILAVLDVNEEGVLAMEGYNPAHESVNELRDALGGSALFTDVRIEYINKRVVPDGEVNYFKIVCRIKEMHR